VDIDSHAMATSQHARRHRLTWHVDVVSKSLPTCMLTWLKLFLGQLFAKENKIKGKSTIIKVWGLKLHVCEN
jgi:hypothetical protein